jgi:cell division protein FtsN
MLNRLLLIVAILGLGLCAYLLLRPKTTQTIRLEPSTALPSQLEQPQPAPKLEIKPAPVVKPRPTQALAAPETPKLPVQQEPAIKPSTPAPSNPSAAPSSPSRDFQDLDSPPVSLTKILTPRFEGAVWRLQVGAFRSAENAEALRQKLQENGLSAKVVLGENGISRVLVGEYSSREAAQADNASVSSRVP